MTEHNQAAPGGYLIRNLGARVEVCRPGETVPFGYCVTVPEAMALVDADRNPWPEERMDMIGLNGNEGEHYGAEQLQKARQCCGKCGAGKNSTHESGCGGARE